MKAITENLAIASLLAISVSMIRLSAYYSVFNIDILNYLEVSEIFQLDFFYLMAVSSIILYLGFGFIGVINSYSFKLNALKTAYISEGGTRLDLHIIVSYVVAVIGLVYFIGRILSVNNARDIAKGKSINEVTMITEENTLVTDSILIYAGRTKGYVFFYDRNKKQSRVFNVGDVKEIRYMKGRDYRKDKEQAL